MQRLQPGSSGIFIADLTVTETVSRGVPTILVKDVSQSVCLPKKLNLDVHGALPRMVPPAPIATLVPSKWPALQPMPPAATGVHKAEPIDCRFARAPKRRSQGPVTGKRGILPPPVQSVTADARPASESLDARRGSKSVHPGDCSD